VSQAVEALVVAMQLGVVDGTAVDLAIDVDGTHAVSQSVAAPTTVRAVVGGGAKGPGEAGQFTADVMVWPELLLLEHRQLDRHDRVLCGGRRKKKCEEE
jgi:hypothetical protein